MLMLGIIGEYIWRTLSQARGRPQYMIEEVIEYYLNVLDNGALSELIV